MKIAFFLIPLSVLLVGCANDFNQEYPYGESATPTAPFAYGTYPKLTKENPYLPRFEEDRLYEGYNASLSSNRTYTGSIIRYQLVDLATSHPAYSRFESRSKLLKADPSGTLPVFLVEVRLDQLETNISVLVENTRYFEVGQRVFVQTVGSSASGFAEMPDAYKTEWNEGYNRALLPDSEYIGMVQMVSRVFIREDNPAFSRLRYQRFAVRFGNGRMDCYGVDVRLMDPSGGSHYVRAYVPLSQGFVVGDKVVVRTHGNALSGWMEVLNYVEAVGGKRSDEVIQ